MLSVMDTDVPRRAWLLMAAGDNRGHGGNAGYDDQADAYYSWDSKVPNHRNLGVGDPIALWDKKRLLGVSVIEAIEESQDHKTLSRCTKCATTRISLRKNTLPRYRCMKCHHEFEIPDADVVPVVRYTARYDAAWTSLEGVLSEKEIRSLAVNLGDINAMRPLNWVALREVLAAKGARRAADRIDGRIDFSWQSNDMPFDPSQGFGHALVRIRRGQQQFRDQLLAAQGSVCAFTGGAPARVLEAGHLYSYAQLGTHFKHGGLMLRRDIHRLFDDGLLAVEPSSLHISVAPALAGYSQYEKLHDKPMKLTLRDEHLDWLGKHWVEHREPARR